ncbi:hypothetical protein OEZ85_005749 [Tetradesmus obliquus]|uniref:ABC transporter domain-containing protein n=1 Tax=Tetradesmus obliquus TaxID=3088 RepID=A0ABY8UEY4_TETOB|nr:hypothetical protein OEZ85_005749 [Tetradesmus obliquus]
MPAKGWQSPFAAAPQRDYSSQQEGSNHGSVSPEDEETVRQERIRLDTYNLPDRRASCEAHGFIQMAPTPQPDMAVLPSYEAQQLMQQQDPATTSSNTNTADAEFSIDPSLHDAPYSRAADSRKLAGNFAGNSPAGPTAHSKPLHATPHAPNTAATNADAEDQEGSKIQQLLQPISEAAGQTPLVLSFEHLSVWAPVNPKKAGWGKQAWRALTCRGGQEANPKRQILYDISGQVRPGEVLALMGPSGSGKTSLLTVLGGRSAMKLSGKVLVNRAAFTKGTRRRVGFVLQDDVLYESLTVKETLSYAALLRLPAGMSRADKLGRVEQVVDALGLRKSKNTIIGGFFRRGISGGERKRVSIGHELLINPAILLLDEPTSGLDSTTALHLISLLQDLAAGGRSIATTIHQPSSRLYQKLDWLMLLAEGHLMYYGKADQVLDWFGQFGFKIPFGVSIADYILDISLGEAGYSSSGKSGSAAVTELYTAFEQQYAGSANAHKHNTGFSYTQPQITNGVNGSSSEAVAVAAADGSGRKKISSKKESHKRVGASYWDQLVVLSQRAGRVRRFEQMTGQHFFQLFAVAFITGLVWWQRGQAYYGGVQAASDVLGLLFFMLLFPSMRALFRALFTFPNEQRMLMKERPSGMYNLSAYYLARTAADIPAELLNTVLFVIIAYWFGGLRHDAGAFFGLLLSLVLVVAVAESWGLLIGGVCMDPKTAQTITTVVILAFLLVGGYYVRNIPVWISWIRWFSFLFWGYNLLIKSQFSGVTYYSCNGSGSSSGCSPVPLSQLALPTDPLGPAYPDVLILLGMLLFLRLVIYFVLRRKTRVKQNGL